MIHVNESACLLAASLIICKRGHTNDRIRNLHVDAFDVCERADLYGSLNRRENLPNTQIIYIQASNRYSMFLREMNEITNGSVHMQ